MQRGSSPGPQNARPGSPSGTPPNVPTAQRLKDKIAHFDALGSAPRPSGSFGLGAPVEHKTTSRELYGNRIPAPRKSGAHSIRDQDISQLSNSSSASLDRDMFARDSASSIHSGEGAEGNVSPVTENSQASHKTESVNIPAIRRTDSLTEHWVDTLQAKPGLALDTPGTETLGVLAPPSPTPEADDTPFPVGPSTPLTSTLIRNLGASSHVPSRQGAETPVSVMVETGSLVDGEQPKLVPDAPGTIPPSPVVTGMQLLGLEDGARAEGETTPTREDSEAGDVKPMSAASLALPTATDESPNTPLARSVDVGEPVVPVMLGGDQQSGASLSSLGLSTGEDPQGKGLTTTNILQLNAESTKLAPNSVGLSGPSSVVVEPGSIAPSLRASPSPKQQSGAHTPEPPSALTPKQATSELPIPPSGTLPLSAATLRLLELEGGKKSGRSGTETPVSVMVETGSSDGKPRDLEGVEPPIATPAPASPATSYFEEPRPVEVGMDGSELPNASASSLAAANPKPDNRTVPAPIRTTTVVTNIRRTKTTSVDQTDSSDMKTPTSNATSFGMSSARTPNTIHKARSRPDLSSASMSSAPPSTNSSQTLTIPNGAVQRRATVGSSSKPQRRRASRVPQMQLLPSGQWGVVDDDSEEEDAGGWAKVTVTRSRWS